MMICSCNSCGKHSRARYTGKYHVTPNNWWVGRSKPWPQYSMGEVHACSEECLEALKNEGHRNLNWKQLKSGKEATTNKAVRKSLPT